MGKPANWNRAKARRASFDAMAALSRSGGMGKPHHGMTKEELRAQADNAVAAYPDKIRKIPPALPGERRKTRSNREP